jgi:putative transposase
MTKKRKHSKAEIAAKLAEADDLVTQGKLQSEIARALDVSVMTLHRWRKRPSGSNGSSQIDQTPQTRIAELQLENSRLRRLVTDLLLEQMKLEEASRVGGRSMRWPLDEPWREPRLIRSSRSG